MGKKIDKILNLIEKYLETEEKVLSFEKLGALFSKKYFVHTSKKIFLVDEKGIKDQYDLQFKEEIIVQNYPVLLTTRSIILIDEDEILQHEFCSVDEEHTHIEYPHIITDRRILSFDKDKIKKMSHQAFQGRYGKKDLPEVINSSILTTDFLEKGEEVLYIHLFENKIYRCASLPKEAQLNTELLLLTNQRLISFSPADDKPLKDSILLSNIMGLDIFTMKSMTERIIGIEIQTLKKDEVRLIEHNLYQKSQESWEEFPRKICQASGLKFFAPQIVKGEENETLIKFYPKTDLEWPKKCCDCAVEKKELKYDPLSVEFSLGTMSYFSRHGMGVQRLKYDIPYCRSCYKKRFKGFQLTKRKAIADVSLDGMIAVLRFDNSDYAKEFVRINSK